MPSISDKSVCSKKQLNVLFKSNTGVATRGHTYLQKNATRGRQLTQYGVTAGGFLFFISPQTKIEWWSEVVAGQGFQEVQAHPDHSGKSYCRLQVSQQICV